MSAATFVSTKRSWARIVAGESVPTDVPQSASAAKATAPLQPAARGERKCLCHGEVLVMLGHYGWIMSLDDIDHPDTRKNGGRIYIHKRDVIEDGVTLTSGDRVVFYLYVDSQGLGAEVCQLDKPEPVSIVDDPEFGPSLAESFLPQSKFTWNSDDEGSTLTASSDSESSWNVCAEEFKPSATPTFAMKSSAVEIVRPIRPVWLGPDSMHEWEIVPEARKDASMNPAAIEFTPKAMCMNPHAAEFIPKDVGMNRDATAFVPKTYHLETAAPRPTRSAQLNNVEVLAINLDYLSDSSDDEESAYGDDASSEAESVVESEVSCTVDFTTMGANQWDAQLEAVVLCAPLTGSALASKRAVSPEGSTSAGSSASDSDEGGGRLAVARPRFPVGFQPPPGLELPAPPGL